MGQHPVLLKACCWPGKLSVCCVGRGPILLRAIPSQSFELTSNQERTGLFFSWWSSAFSFFFFKQFSLLFHRAHFVCARTHVNLQAGCSWSPPPHPLPRSLPAPSSPRPPEPHPCLTGPPSPQPPGRHPERREAQTWPEAIYRGWGVGRNWLLCLSSVSGNYRIPPFPRKPSFAGFQK